MGVLSRKPNRVRRQAMPVAMAIQWKPLRDSHYVVASLQPRGGGYRHIFARQAVLRDVQAVVGSGSAQPVVGLLLGQQFECALTLAPYVIIDTHVEVSVQFLDEEAIVQAIGKLLDRSPKQRGLEVIGWYSSSRSPDVAVSRMHATAHGAGFDQPWQTALIFDSAGSAGAFFLYDSRATCWFHAPFYELLDPKTAQRTSKPTCIEWPAYLTTASVVPVTELVQAAPPPFAPPTPIVTPVSAPVVSPAPPVPAPSQRPAPLGRAIVTSRPTPTREAVIAAGRAAGRSAIGFIGALGSRTTDAGRRTILAMSGLRARWESLAARRRAEREAERVREEERRARAEARRAKEAAERQAAREEAQRLAAEAEQRRAAEAEARRLVEAEARRKAAEQAEQRRAVEAEARRKAAEEAERRAAVETEARRKAAEEVERRRAAEAEARRIAEAEAQRKAAEEAEARRIAAEAEAQRQAEAEEERRRVAELEARRQAAEAEARRLAEAEARQLAEAEARRLAEDEARRRAAEEERFRVLAAEAEAQRRAAESEAASKRQAAEAEEEAKRKAAEAEALRISVEVSAIRTRLSRPPVEVEGKKREVTRPSDDGADFEDTRTSDGPYRYLALARREGFEVSEKIERGTPEQPETVWLLHDESSGLRLIVVTTDDELCEATLHYNVRTEDDSLLELTPPEHRDLRSRTIYGHEPCMDGLRKRCRRLRASGTLEREWKAVPAIAG